MAGDSYEVGDIDKDAIVVQGTGHQVTVNRCGAPVPPRPVTWPVRLGVVPPVH
jgi:hypothetical protein